MSGDSRYGEMHHPYERLEEDDVGIIGRGDEEPISGDQAHPLIQRSIDTHQHNPPSADIPTHQQHSQSHEVGS